MRHVNNGHTSMFFFLIFWTKGNKIADILALLSTELSSLSINFEVTITFLAI